MKTAIINLEIDKNKPKLPRYSEKLSHIRGKSLSRPQTACSTSSSRKTLIDFFKENPSSAIPSEL